MWTDELRERRKPPLGEDPVPSSSALNCRNPTRPEEEEEEEEAGPGQYSKRCIVFMRKRRGNQVLTCFLESSHVTRAHSSHLLIQTSFTPLARPRLYPKTKTALLLQLLHQEVIYIANDRDVCVCVCVFLVYYFLSLHFVLSILTN